LQTEGGYVMKTLLERIESEYGPIIAFDGRLAFWTRTDVIDIRDAAIRLRVSRAEIVESMPEFKPAKRGRPTLEAEAEGE
jgi:hypothetical protein